MIDKGANPYVVRHSGNSQFDDHNLGYLSNLPNKKSIYFTIGSIHNDFKNKANFFDPWFYKTGIFGKFNSIIGKGASGIVLSGEWFGRKAAFKFVDVGYQKQTKMIADSLRIFNEKLSEMRSIQQTEGSKILSFYGHYR